MSPATTDRARSLSIALTIAGAAAAVAKTVYTGRTNPSVLLIAVMSVWVFAPFGLLLALHANRCGWTGPGRRVLYTLAPVLAVAMAFTLWLQLFKPARSPNAFLFVIVPPVACLVIGVLAATLFMQRRGAARRA